MLGSWPRFGNWRYWFPSSNVEIAVKTVTPDCTSTGSHGFVTPTLGVPPQQLHPEIEGRRCMPPIEGPKCDLALNIIGDFVGYDRESSSISFALFPVSGSKAVPTSL